MVINTYVAHKIMSYVFVDILRREFERRNQRKDEETCRDNGSDVDAQRVQEEA